MIDYNLAMPLDPQFQVGGIAENLQSVTDAPSDPVPNPGTAPIFKTTSYAGASIEPPGVNWILLILAALGLRMFLKRRRR